MRAVRILSLLILIAFGVVACGQGALDGLSAEERAFVIPDAGDWGEGNPCDEADCTGSLTVAAMQSWCWAEIDPTSWSVEGIDGEEYGNGFFEVMNTLRGAPDDVVLGEFAIGRSQWMREAAAAGHRLVISTECATDASAETIIFEVIAIDEQGRVAGIGVGAELLTTLPLAEGAAEAQADSGEAYLLSVLRS